MGPDLLLPDLTAGRLQRRRRQRRGRRSRHNSTDTEFYCVYAGESSATGGIELDAFIVVDPTTLDDHYGYVGYGSLAADRHGQDVPAPTRPLPSALGGADFGTIAVQSGNLSFGLSFRRPRLETS